MEETNWLALVVIAAAVAVLLVILRRGKAARFDQPVYEWQVGLIYRGGKFERQVVPGRYWLFFNRSLFTVPATPQTLVVSAQEVLAADRLQVKLTGVITYRISEPRKLFEDTAGATDSGLTLDLQLALRELAASRPLEKLIDARKELDGELALLVRARAEARGVAIETAAVRDLILNAETRRLYAEFERARLEGLAALERARGEQAALRSLANAARLLKGNPELMNLRLLQALAGQPGKAPPTIVLGGAAGIVPVAGGAEASPAD